MTPRLRSGFGLPLSCGHSTEVDGPAAGLHSYLRPRPGRRLAGATVRAASTGGTPVRDGSPRGERPSLRTTGVNSGATYGNEERCRVHLRVEPDGSSLLLVNANSAYHLNPTASLLAWLNLEGRSQDEAIRALQDKYRVRREVARSDVARMWADIETLTHPEGACPIHDSELEVVPPFSQATSAPLRMDLALTYRCNDDCAHCYNARHRSFPEMPTEAWKQVLERVRDIGVPHVCFTGGEATLRHDLPELTAHASSLGLVTGLLTNGRRLSNAGYVDQLVASGLDHVQITLESHDEATHDRMVRTPGAWRQTVQGIRNALAARLYVMTNTTLLADNASGLGETLDFLAELGVPTVGCNALIHTGLGSQVGTGLPERSLAPLLEIAKERTEVHGQKLIWYTPTQYCHFDPVQGELGVKGCTAARYNMAVEPDGSVLPCQSYYQPLGNLLRDSWDSIWNHELSIRLRDKSYVGEGCRTCVFFQECGGGCPLSPPQPTFPLAAATPNEARMMA